MKWFVYPMQTGQMSVIYSIFLSSQTLRNENFYFIAS